MANKKADRIIEYRTKFIESAGAETKLPRVARCYGWLPDGVLPMDGRDPLVPELGVRLGFVLLVGVYQLICHPDPRDTRSIRRGSGGRAGVHLEVARAARSGGWPAAGLSVQGLPPVDPCIAPIRESRRFKGLNHFFLRALREVKARAERRVRLDGPIPRGGSGRPMDDRDSYAIARGNPEKPAGDEPSLEFPYRPTGGRVVGHSDRIARRDEGNFESHNGWESYFGTAAGVNDLVHSGI